MAEGLRRRIGPGLLTAYGVGVIVGAGIYVLVGAVAARAGIWAPVSFLLAGCVAAPSALSYAEISTRIPEAAGEAAYIETGLQRHWLAVLVGLAIVAAGTVSAAAVLRGGVGYLTALIDVPSPLAILVVGGLLIGVALIGVLESLSVAALFTVIELGGLGLVIWAGLVAVPAPSPDWVDWHGISLVGVGLGATLAFFAFIGFEDIVNMAEEVRNPSRDLPLAILLSLVISAVLYGIVALAAVRAVPLDQLAGSEQPLALVWQAGTGQGAGFLSGIAVIAALNGVLAQIVMAARVLYGLGKRSPSLTVFRHTSARFGTPVLATGLVGAAVLLSALTLPITSLATVTTGLLLSVFVLVNAALLRLKARTPEAPFQVPVWVPWAGLLSALALLAMTTLGGLA